MFALIGWIVCLCIALLAFSAGCAALNIALMFGSTNKGDYWVGFGLLVVGVSVIAALVKFSPLTVSFSTVV